MALQQAHVCPHGTANDVAWARPSWHMTPDREAPGSNPEPPDEAQVMMLRCPGSR